MKALRSALCLMPVALAAWTLTGCQAYSRAWKAEHAKEYGSRPAKAPKKTDQAAVRTQPEGAVTIVQAGNPREDGDAPEPPRLETKAERARRERAEQDRTRQPATSGQPATSTPAPAAAPAPAMAPSMSAMPAASAAPRAVAAAPAVAPSVGKRTSRMQQRELNAMLRGTNDAQITAMFLMVNDIDISFAKLALARSDNPDVQAYAKRMINDHAQAIAAVRQLIDREGMFPAENRLSRDMRDESAWDRDSLRVLSGRAFDSAYVARQVSYHKQLLSMIDDVLLPRAHDGELLRVISTMRPAISAHLAHAQQLEANLGIRDVSMTTRR